MAIEDFTSYSEVDPNSRITKTTRRVAWAALDRNETAYVYRDKGVDFFDGGFTHLLTVYIAASVNGSYVNTWALTNILNSLRVIDNASGDFLAVAVLGLAETNTISLIECDGGDVSEGTDTYEDASLATAYYLKIVRDESVGEFGTLYCYIYSDSARTTLVDTLTVTLHTSTKDFRYIHAVNSDNSTATPYPGSGYSENLELFATLFSVTTQPVTSITDTTATGNGIIVNTGQTTVTQHGHCWDLTINPTTTDSSSGLWGKTSNGEGSVGSFTSSIDGLSVGQKYYVRAYATNAGGTVYGANVTFTAGYTSTQLIEGNIAVVQERLHYMDAYGVERYIMGTPT